MQNSLSIYSFKWKQRIQSWGGGIAYSAGNHDHLQIFRADRYLLLKLASKLQFVLPLLYLRIRNPMAIEMASGSTLI